MVNTWYTTVFCPWYPRVFDAAYVLLWPPGPVLYPRHGGAPLSHRMVLSPRSSGGSVSQSGMEFGVGRPPERGGFPPLKPSRCVAAGVGCRSRIEFDTIYTDDEQKTHWVRFRYSTHGSFGSALLL